MRKIVNLISQTISKNMLLLSIDFSKSVKDMIVVYSRAVDNEEMIEAEWIDDFANSVKDTTSKLVIMGKRELMIAEHRS